MYTLGQAAKEVGCSKATISRAIKNGKLSASKNDDNTYNINAAELQRWLDSNGHVTPPSKRRKTPLETHETPNENSALKTELEALKKLADERAKTIEDLRGRLDKESEERRQITMRMLDYEKPKGFWSRLTGK